MTTKHNHEPNFGRKISGCPRCDELAQGAKPVKWAPSKAQQDMLASQAVRSHNCQRSGCSMICTYGDW